MANELTIPGGDNKLSVPAHIAARFKAEESNIITGDRTPSLTVKGKVFTIQAEGETTPLMKSDDEGNEYPLASLPVVILDYAAKMGRNYFEGAYNPDEVKAPVCWSLDGVTPEAEVPEETKDTITSHKCATCPMAVKGSSVTDNGKSVAACAQHRILAVVPVKRLDLPPMRLRLAQTSNYDGRSPDLKQKGLFAFSNYLDAIKARGISHTQSIVTQLSFDPAAAYPKLLFKAVRYVDDAELAKIDAILASGKVEDIMGRTSVNNAKAVALAAPAKAPALAAPAKAAAVVVPDEDEDDEEAAAMAALAAAKAKKAAAAEAEAAAEAKRKAAAAAAAAKAAAEAAAAADGEEDEDDEEAALAAKLAAIKAKKAAAAAGTVAAEPVATAEPAKRTRRTKAEIEAANLAAAQAKGETLTKDGDAKVFPKSVGGADLGDDDDGGEAMTGEVIPPKKPANGGAAAAAKPKVIEAAAVAVPAEVASMLTSWED